MYYVCRVYFICLQYKRCKYYAKTMTLVLYLL